MCRFPSQLKLCISIFACISSFEPSNEEKIDNRIIGGSKCAQSQPYFVALHKPFGHHYCGGSLLSTFWVLTAAHCDKPDQYALMGFKTGELDSMTYWSVVYKRFANPHWNPETMRNDIALMRLASPVYEGAFIQYVGLPLQMAPWNQSVTVMGMGRTRDSTSAAASKTLNCVEISAITFGECSSYYPSFDMENVLCTNTVGRDACQGDSGGPMMCGRVQCGIVSWGFGCGDGFPGVYTKVDKYLNFILGTIQRNGKKKVRSDEIVLSVTILSVFVMSNKN